MQKKSSITLFSKDGFMINTYKGKLIGLVWFDFQLPRHIASRLTSVRARPSLDAPHGAC